MANCEEETPTKRCDTCHGKGWKIFHVPQYEWGQAAPVAWIPTFRKCPVCFGTGVIELTEEEIMYERLLRRIDEREKLE